jgi:hypothetical protein
VARAIAAPSSAPPSADHDQHRNIENIYMLAASQQHPFCYLLRFQTLFPQATLAEAMGKHRENLWKWFSKDGRATAPPGTLSGEQIC